MTVGNVWHMPGSVVALAVVLVLAVASCSEGAERTATPPADRPSTATGPAAPPGTQGSTATTGTAATTAPAAGPTAIRLRSDGIGDVPFGTAEADVRAALTAAFGPPGFEESLPDDSCSTGATRRLSWSDLQVLLGPDGAGRLTLVGWTYGTADPPAEPALTTAEGIGVGSSLAQLRSAYGRVEVTEDAGAGVVRFSAQAGNPPRPLDGVLTDASDSAAVRALYAGSYCG